MQRRELLLGGGTAAVAALAGCLGGAQADEGDESSVESRTIVVRKTGEVEAEPNRAIFRAGVESTGQSAVDVRDDLARRAETVRQALLDAGLGEDQVRTGRFDVHQRIDRRRMEQEGVRPDEVEDRSEYTYYEGTHSLTVDVDDVDAVGDLLDTAVDAGADEIGRVQFTLSEDRRADLRETAIQQALADARSEAEFVASEVGANVREVRKVDTTESQVSPYRADVAYESGDGASAPTEIHPDDVTVTANVEVIFDVE